MLPKLVLGSSLWVFPDKEVVFGMVGLCLDLDKPNRK